MPGPEKPETEREQREAETPRRSDRIVNPGDETFGSGDSDEHEITQRTPRPTDDTYIEEDDA